MTYELNKAAFGRFLAQLRREKGMTQKDIAARLYVSDKAMSKWERGLSVPDISLLVPPCVAATTLLERAVHKPVWVVVLLAEVLSLFGCLIFPAKKYE